MRHSAAVRMVAIGSRLDAQSVELAGLARSFDRDCGYVADGCTSTVAWLKIHCRLSKGMAAEVMAVARQLPALPEVERAVSSGEIGFQHAAAIAESADRLGSESLLLHQAELVEKAEASDPSSFRDEVKRVEHRVDAEKMRREAEWAYESRRLQVVTKRDGRVAVEGLLDAEGGAVLKKALDAAMGARSKTETRTETQRRADGLVDVARRCLDGRQLGQTGCQRPHLSVAVGTDGQGSIDGVGPISKETLERLLCDCSLSVNGSPEVRTFSPPQRRALALKTRHCQFPTGCDRPADWCDGHHLDWWVESHRTETHRGLLLCGFHHRLVHEGGWRVCKEGDVVVAIAPDGRRFESAKAPP